MTIELNPTYFEAMLRYCQEAEVKRSAPMLFSLETLTA